MTDPTDAQLDYNNLVGDIKRSPQTWLPSLLSVCVGACIEKKVFRSLKSLERFVTMAILRHVNPKGER